MFTPWMGEETFLEAQLKWGHLHKYFLIELFMAPPYMQSQFLLQAILIDINQQK